MLEYYDKQFDFYYHYYSRHFIHFIISLTRKRTLGNTVLDFVIFRCVIRAVKPKYSLIQLESKYGGYICNICFAVPVIAFDYTSFY